MWYGWYLLGLVVAWLYWYLAPPRKRSSSELLRRYGPCALITGVANDGLGGAYARNLAEMGFDLIVTGRAASKIEEAARSLRGSFPDRRIYSVVLDMNDEPTALISRLTTFFTANPDADVGLLVLNHTIVCPGPFLDASLSCLLETQQTNARGYAVMTHYFGNRMRTRARNPAGGIILLSSVACFGSAFLSLYGSTKAYQVALGRSLWDEWRRLPTNSIDITAVIAGPTYTAGLVRFFGSRQNAPLFTLRADDVVLESLNGLGRQPQVSPGIVNKLIMLLFALLPVKLSLGIFASNIPEVHRQPTVSASEEKRAWPSRSPETPQS